MTLPSESGSGSPQLATSSWATWVRRYPFPDPRDALPDGPLAIGGDLSPGRLLSAYSQGIFPWYDERVPLLWWSPDPRFVLFPEDFRLPRRLRRTRGQPGWTVTFDTAFSDVIRACAEASRPEQDGTWITDEMEQAYCELHRRGYAHSAECWRDGELAGGLYGVSLGSVFFGESMFFRVPDASKVAFAAFAEALWARRFTLIDCQQETDHLARFGARAIPRDSFLDLLVDAVRAPTHRGSWAAWSPEPRVSAGRA